MGAKFETVIEENGEVLWVFDASSAESILIISELL